MSAEDKRKVCQRTAIWIAILSLADVLGLEFGFLPEDFADSALNVFIALLAAALAGNFYYKHKQGKSD